MSLEQQFEEKLSRGAGTDDAATSDVTIWCDYIQALMAAQEQAADGFRRVNVVFERALRALPSSFKLWDSYITERMYQMQTLSQQQQPQQQEQECAAVNAILALFERAVAAFADSPQVTLFQRWFTFAVEHGRFVVAAAVLQLGIRLLRGGNHTAEGVALLVRHCASCLAAPTPIVAELLRFNSSSRKRPPLPPKRVALIIENLVARGDVLEAAVAAINAIPTNSFPSALTADHDGENAAKMRQREEQTRYAPQLDAARRQRQRMFLPIVARALDAVDSSNFGGRTAVVVDVCKRFVALIWEQNLDSNSAAAGSSTTASYASTIVSVVACLCRVGEIALGRELLQASFQHARSDEDVQTLHICLVSLNIEDAAGTATSSSSSSSSGAGSASYAMDLSPEALRRQVALWRTVRDPTSATNWLELVALTAQPDDALFQRAISACTTTTAATRLSTAATFTRTTHLFLAYARWLETSGRAASAVELLKRASGVAANDADSGVWLHSDKVALLRAAAEVLLRTSPALDRVIDFTAWACEAVASSSSSIPPATAAPLFSLHVELLLAKASSCIAARDEDDDDESERAARSTARLGNPALQAVVDATWGALRNGSCTTKLLLTVCDALVKDHQRCAQSAAAASSSSHIDLVAQLLHTGMQLQGRAGKSSTTQQHRGDDGDDERGGAAALVLYAASCYLFGHVAAAAPSSVHPLQRRRIEMIRHVHKSAMATGCFDASAGSPPSAAMCAAWFALAALEEQHGTLHNSLQALRSFCEAKLARLAAALSALDEHESAGGGRIGSGDAAPSSPASRHRQQQRMRAEIDAVLSYYLRRVAQVTPVRLLSSLAEGLLRRVDQRALLAAGMQIVRLQLAGSAFEPRAPDAASGNAPSASKESARASLRALAPLEDPERDESGVWRTWLDLEVAENNAAGFGELQRLKRAEQARAATLETVVMQAK